MWTYSNQKTWLSSLRFYLRALLIYVPCYLQLFPTVRSAIWLIWIINTVRRSISFEYLHQTHNLTVLIRYDTLALHPSLSVSDVRPQHFAGLRYTKVAIRFGSAHTRKKLGPSLSFEFIIAGIRGVYLKTSSLCNAQTLYSKKDSLNLVIEVIWFDESQATLPSAIILRWSVSEDDPTRTSHNSQGRAHGEPQIDIKNCCVQSWCEKKWEALNLINIDKHFKGLQSQRWLADW